MGEIVVMAKYGENWKREGKAENRHERERQE
jgi:hypothetical protein